jgi:hypothetical protein
MGEQDEREKKAIQKTYGWRARVLCNLSKLRGVGIRDVEHLLAALQSLTQEGQENPYPHVTRLLLSCHTSVARRG